MRKITREGTKSKKRVKVDCFQIIVRRAGKPSEIEATDFPLLNRDRAFRIMRSLSTIEMKFAHQSQRIIKENSIVVRSPFVQWILKEV